MSPLLAHGQEQTTNSDRDLADRAFVNGGEMRTLFSTVLLHTMVWGRKKEDRQTTKETEKQKKEIK